MKRGSHVVTRNAKALKLFCDLMLAEIPEFTVQPFCSLIKRFDPQCTSLTVKSRLLTSFSLFLISVQDGRGALPLPGLMNWSVLSQFTLPTYYLQGREGCSTKTYTYSKTASTQPGIWTQEFSVINRKHWPLHTSVVLIQSHPIHVQYFSLSS